jgi:ribosome-associated toxin RatA of RatAB toxin-antitoxin module
MSHRALALAFVLLPLAARAETLESLLGKGTVMLVEDDPEGKFAAATGIVEINAPIEKVWSVITNYGAYKDFVPRVASVKVVSGAGTYDPRVRLEIDTPVFNTVYTVHFHLNEANHSITGEWVEGALKGSHWDWKMESSGPGKTIVFYKSVSKNFSAFVESLDDKQQTMTVGINVGGVMTVLHAMKKRAES